jgi:hypothetical protein
MSAHGLTQRKSLVVARELLVVFIAAAVYWGGRGLTEGSEALAIENGLRVVDLEKALGIFWEMRMQDAIHDSDVLVTLANWVYIYGHWPVIFGIAAWAFVRHPNAYFLTRNAFLMSGLIGLVVFVVFPVAPPRLLDIGFIDTVTERSESYRLLQPPSLTNQYAAMPSLHFGWDLLVGIVLVRRAGLLPFRIAGVVLPGAMVLAVVVTANHYILDAVAGGSLALIALGICWYVRPLGPGWLWEHGKRWGPPR